MEGSYSSKTAFAWGVALFLYFSNFLGVGIYVPVLFIPYTIIVVITRKHSRLFFLTLTFLFSFCATFAMISYMYGFIKNINSILSIGVYPSVLYVLGYLLINNLNKYKDVIRYICIMIVSSVAFGFLSYVTTIFTYGSMENVILLFRARAVENVWTKELITGTGVNTYLSLGLGTFFAFFMKNGNQTIRIKVIILISFIAAFYATVGIGNRTGIAIMVISMIVVYLLSDRSLFKKIMLAVIISILFLISRMLFNRNVFNVKDSWESTTVASRFRQETLGDDPRIDAWISSFKGLFEYPLGGRETELQLVYAHNAWLDVGYDAGLLPFILFLVFTIISLLSILNLIRGNHPKIIKGLFIGLFSSILLTFFLEPIMQGWIVYFTVFCFIVGITQKINYLYEATTEIAGNKMTYQKSYTILKTQ